MSNIEAADKIAQAIRIFAEEPEALENFEYYLSHHFNKWLELYANTPEGLVSEFYNFATIYRDESEV